MTIYERIRMLRINKGMSQDELGKRCGYEGRSMVSRVESGRVDLPLSKVDLFAKRLAYLLLILLGTKIIRRNSTAVCSISKVKKKCRNIYRTLSTPVNIKNIISMKWWRTHR